MEKEYDIEPHIKLLLDTQNQISQYINESKFEKRDVRISIYHNSIDMLRCCLVMMNLVHSIQLGVLPLQAVSPILGLKTRLSNEIPLKDVENFFSMFLQFARFSLIAMTHFQIENYLKIVLARLTNSSHIGFYKIAETLLNKVTISDKENKLRVMNTLALMRNTYHSNGTHTRKSETIIINGVLFEFKEGERCSCAGWQHINIVLSEIFKIINEINHTAEVSSIKENIGNIYKPNE